MTTTEQCKQLVDIELEKLLPKKDPSEFYNSMNEQVLTGGKRIRPIFCLLVCEALGGNVETAVPVAAAVELIQAMSLVHDDIMDQDELRRGKPTLWKTQGEALAIDVGDGIFAKSIEALLRYTGENYQEVFKVGIINMCEGQAWDVLFEKKDSLTIEDYNQMSILKTGVHIATSLKLGAMIANADKQTQEKIYSAGIKLGLAYQIWDDYIDFASNKTGKTRGSDIKKGKKTSIVCHALQHLEETDKAELVKILETSVEETTEEMINNAIQLLDKTGSIEFAKTEATRLIEESKKELDILPDSEAKNEILKIVGFIVTRES
jgi:geranylgeranyl diphosphate synthase type I